MGWGKPLIIRSVYRSPEHNRAIGGATRSKHLDGAALDIAMTNHDPVAFEAAAREVGFLGFGFYPRSGFIHVDLGPARAGGQAVPSPDDHLCCRDAASARGARRKPDVARHLRSRNYDGRCQLKPVLFIVGILVRGVLAVVLILRIPDNAHDRPALPTAFGKHAVIHQRIARGEVIVGKARGILTHSERWDPRWLERSAQEGRPFIIRIRMCS
ncbi:MAG: DUF882 domain-containing protein [Loktanella sp.]|nr:DUF882 domain-containing protein [Loktanella sp.]